MYICINLSTFLWGWFSKTDHVWCTFAVPNLGKHTQHTAAVLKPLHCHLERTKIFQRSSDFQ